MAREANRILYCATLNTCFDGPQQAAQWLRENGYPQAHDKTIVWAVTGRQKTAYGHIWRWADYKGTRVNVYNKAPVRNDAPTYLPLFHGGKE